MSRSWSTLSIGKLLAVTLAVSLCAIPARAGKKLNNASFDRSRCKAKTPEEQAKCAPFVNEETLDAMHSECETTGLRIFEIEQLMELNTSANYHHNDTLLQDRLAAYKSIHQVFLQIASDDTDASRADAYQTEAEFYSRLGPGYKLDKDCASKYARSERGEPSSNTLAAIQSAMSIYLASRGQMAPPPSVSTEPSSSVGSRQSSNTVTAQPTTLNNDCVARDPEPWSIGDKKTVAVLKLRNTCAKPLYVSFCFKSPSDRCWKCTQINVASGQSATSMDLVPGCATTNCSELQTLYNASFSTNPPKPNVDDSCVGAVH